MHLSGALKLSRLAASQQRVIISVPTRRTLRSSGTQSTTDPDLTLASGPPHRGLQVHQISEEILPPAVGQPSAAKHKVPESLVSAQVQTDLPVGLPKTNPPGGDNKREIPLLSHHPKSGGVHGGIPPPPLAKNKHSIRLKKAIKTIIQGNAERPCTRARCCQSRPNTRRVSRGSESEHPPCRLFVLGFHSRGSGTTVTQKNRPTTRRRHDSHRRIIVCNVKREFPTAANMSPLGPSSGLECVSSEGKPSDNNEVKVKRKRGRPPRLGRETNGGKQCLVGSLGTKVTCGGGQCSVDDTTGQRLPSPAACDPGTAQHDDHMVLSGAQLVNSFPTGFTNIISVHPKPMWVAASERPVRRSVKTPCCGLCGVCIYLPYQSKLWAQRRLESKSPEHPIRDSKKAHSESNNGHKKIIVWLSRYPKVTLCDMAKRFDVRQDCGYMLPAALKTKAVGCFQRDLKPGVLLKHSRSDKCGNKSSTSAKCKKRSSSPHKLTDPQMKHSRQYTALDPTCHSLETGKGELERPANCSASLSLGKMETKVQCGTGILDRHTDDDPEAVCALIAEERQVESDLIVAEKVQCGNKSSTSAKSRKRSSNPHKQTGPQIKHSRQYTAVDPTCHSLETGKGELERPANCSPSLSLGKMETKVQCGTGILDRHTDDDPEAGCALIAEERQVESDLIVAEKVQCGNKSSTNAKSRKRSSNPHKLTGPHIKHSRQYTAVDPTCHSLETGKGELERPANCSPSLSLGKMETKVQCGTGILDRHTDDDPEAGCALIAEERHAVSDLIVPERQAVKKIKLLDGGTNGILPSRPDLEIRLANEQVMVDTVGREEIEYVMSVDSQSCLDPGIGCSDTSDMPELPANCSASLTLGKMETKVQCGTEILDRHIEDDPNTGCALIAEERQAESDLIVAEQVMVDTVGREEIESVMSVDSQSCFDMEIRCSDTSDTPVEKYRDQVDSSFNSDLKESDVAQGSYTSAKCRKRSSSPHKLTDPQIKHSRQYTAVDPTSLSLETGKGELERPANCSASLSLGKMETKVQCGTGILDRHIDDDPEAGCALIAEERPAESDLIVAEQVMVDTVGREEIETVMSVDSQSCLDSGIGCSDTSDTPVEKYRDQVDSSLNFDLKESDVSQLFSQNSGDLHLLDDDDDMEQPELFSCQRARVYFKQRHLSCARTYIRWPFNKSSDPAPEIPAAIETLPAGMSYPPAREDILITSQPFCHQGKDGERDEEVPNRREDGEHTAVEKDVKIGTNQLPHSLGTLEPLANAPSSMAILSSPSHVRETASHLYTCSPIPHDLLANCTDMVTADTPPIVYSSDLIFHDEEMVTTSSQSPESYAPLNSDFSHSYKSSHISSSDEETDTASEQSPKSTAPSNSDLSDSCKSSLISSPDQQEKREDVCKESVLPKNSKCLSPLPNSDDLTLASGKECTLLKDTTEKVSVHPLACSAADGEEGNSTVDSSRQKNEKLSCSDGGPTQSSDDMLTSPSKMVSLGEDEPEVETAEGSNTNRLDEFTAYEKDILLVDVMQDDPDLFGNLPKESLLKLGPTRVLGTWSSGTAKQSSSLVKAEMSSIRFDPRLRGNIPEKDDNTRCWKTLCSSTRSLTQVSTWCPTEERNQAMDILDDNNNYLEEDDPERYPASVSLRETEPARACQSFADLRFQKYNYCRLYFSENRCCPYKDCRYLHVPGDRDERFCFEAMKIFINSQNAKCLQKAGAVFTSYYNSNPMGMYFSMPVLMSLLRALLKAGSVSDIISVIIISLTRNVMPDCEFLQALLNFVIEKGLNDFVPQLTQLTSKVVNAGQAQNLDCVELVRIMSTPVAQNLTHTIMEVELCTKQEDWKQLGVVFKSLCQSSQVTSELERISGRISIALLSETKDKIALPFVTFAETACQDESDDGVMKLFVGRIGVSLMFRYHKTHHWAQGKRVVEVLSRLQIKYSMLKGLFGNEDGASRCYLVTIATELFFMSDSVEGALNILRDNEWFLSSSSWPCEPCDLEKRSHVLIPLAKKLSYREALDVFSNLPGLKEPIDHINASQYGPLLNSHLQVCMNKQAVIVAADTALFMFSKNLRIDTALLQMLLIKLGKQNRWDQARKVFKPSLSVGYYPDVSAPPGLMQLTVPCSLEEHELALVFEMFVTVNATAILNLEDPTPVLRITLKRTHQCEKEYISAGNRIYSAAGIPFPKLKLTLHRTEGIGSQEQVFILDTLKARCWLRHNIWAKDFWTHSS